jgi:hypothetical protein
MRVNAFFLSFFLSLSLFHHKLGRVLSLITFEKLIIPILFIKLNSPLEAGIGEYSMNLTNSEFTHNSAK